MPDGPGYLISIRRGTADAQRQVAERRPGLLDVEGIDPGAQLFPVGMDI